MNITSGQGPTDCSVTNKLLFSISGIIASVLVACGERPPEVEAADTAPDKFMAETIVEVETPQMTLGKRVFASCASCHTVNHGGANGIGPNLSGVLGSVAASKANFDYSDALTDAPIVWTKESLDRYLENPAITVPGGSMVFTGVKDAAERAAVIAYLIATTGNQEDGLTVPSKQGDDVAIWE